jgi:TolA-binding protein
LAEDARYWKAMALARTGSRHAVDELTSFVATYRSSVHFEDASLLLGWKLLEAGRRDEAARHFRVALGSASKDVRDSANAGLIQLESGR